MSNELICSAKPRMVLSCQKGKPHLCKTIFCYDFKMKGKRVTWLYYL